MEIYRVEVMIRDTGAWKVMYQGADKEEAKDIYDVLAGHVRVLLVGEVKEWISLKEGA